MAEELLFTLFAVAFGVAAIGFILHKLRQPQVVSYILAGIVLGPSILNVIETEQTVRALGEIGIVFLMFFVGLEISLPNLMSNWRVAIVGTLMQVIAGLSIAFLLGVRYGWSPEMSMLIGFIVSISSTAVVIKVLTEWKEMHTSAGQNAVGILVVQDLAVIPMLVMITLLGTGGGNYLVSVAEIAGGFIMISVLYAVLRDRSLTLPLMKSLESDPELYMFFALVVCFGLSLLSSALGLSAAFGAFIAGLLVAEFKLGPSTRKTLEPFYIAFLAIFFISVGMLIDLSFVIENIEVILAIVIASLVLKTAVNAFILHRLGRDHGECIYAGAVLSQMGEFGFVLASAGLAAGIITGGASDMIIAVIAVSLVLSPLWIITVRKAMHISRHRWQLPGDLNVSKLENIYNVCIKDRGLNDLNPGHVKTCFQEIHLNLTRGEISDLMKRGKRTAGRKI
jgi:monovalent cation:H+ antiporter-2, CPA2 family